MKRAKKIKFMHVRDSKVGYIYVSSDHEKGISTKSLYIPSLKYVMVLSASNFYGYSSSAAPEGENVKKVTIALFDYIKFVKYIKAHKRAAMVVGGYMGVSPEKMNGYFLPKNEIFKRI